MRITRRLDLLSKNPLCLATECGESEEEVEIHQHDKRRPKEAGVYCYFAGNQCAALLNDWVTIVHPQTNLPK